MATHFTVVSSYVASAGGAVEAGFIFTVIHLTLTVAACVITRALAEVRVSRVDTVTAVMTELVRLKTYNTRRQRKRHVQVATLTTQYTQNVEMENAICNTSLHGRHLTGDSWDVAVSSRPAAQAVAGKRTILCPAAGAVLTWV